MNSLLSAAAAAPLALGWPVHAWRLRRRIEAARRDPLSGLPTREAFENTAHRLLNRGPLAVAVIDLDGFKQINDTHGHAIGDAVIREAGTWLSEWNTVRARGAVGRLGGDEFAAVFPAGDFEDAHTALCTLHELLTLRATLEGVTLRVGASVGGYWTSEPSAAGWSPLLRLADAAMYAAKQDGGGVFTTDGPGLDLPTVNGRRAGRPGTDHGERDDRAPYATFPAHGTKGGRS